MGMSDYIAILLVFRGGDQMGTAGSVRNSLFAIRKFLKINGTYLEEAARLRLDTIRNRGAQAACRCCEQRIPNRELVQR